MNEIRYHEVNINGGTLTREEMAEGWHFCPYWNYLLIGPGMNSYLYSCKCRSFFKDEDYKKRYFNLV